MQHSSARLKPSKPSAKESSRCPWPFCGERSSSTAAVRSSQTTVATCAKPSRHASPLSLAECPPPPPPPMLPLHRLLLRHHRPHGLQLRQSPQGSSPSTKPASGWSSTSQSHGYVNAHPSERSRTNTQTQTPNTNTKRMKRSFIAFLVLGRGVWVAAKASRLSNDQSSNAPISPPPPAAFANTHPSTCMNTAQPFFSFSPSSTLAGA